MGFGLVGECLPWDWLTESYGKFLTYVLIHLINKIEHGEIEFQVELLTSASYVVELVGIMS